METLYSTIIELDSTVEVLEQEMYPISNRLAVAVAYITSRVEHCPGEHSLLEKARLAYKSAMTTSVAHAQDGLQGSASVEAMLHEIVSYYQEQRDHLYTSFYY